MLEWLKRHAWKACRRQKRLGGSNPPLSAKKQTIYLLTNKKIINKTNKVLILKKLNTQ